MKRLRLWFRRRQLLRRYLNRIGYQLLLEELAIEKEKSDQAYLNQVRKEHEEAEAQTNIARATAPITDISGTMAELIKEVDNAPKYDLDKLKMDVINRRSRSYK